mgnify:CR=1 FL=1
MIISIDDPDGLAVLEALPADVKSHTVAYGTTARESLPDLGGAAYVWIASESETAGSGVEQLTLHLPAAVTAGEPVSQSVALKVPGVHNARNAAAAISAAVLLGVSPADAAKAAGTFLGAARRFQVRGTVKQVTVVDDYATIPPNRGPAGCGPTPVPRFDRSCDLPATPVLPHQVLRAPVRQILGQSR